LDRWETVEFPYYPSLKVGPLMGLVESFKLPTVGSSAEPKRK